MKRSNYKKRNIAVGILILFFTMNYYLSIFYSKIFRMVFGRCPKHKKEKKRYEIYEKNV